MVNLSRGFLVDDDRDQSRESHPVRMLPDGMAEDIGHYMNIGACKVMLLSPCLLLL